MHRKYDERDDQSDKRKVDLGSRDKPKVPHLPDKNIKVLNHRMDNDELQFLITSELCQTPRWVLACEFHNPKAVGEFYKNANFIAANLDSNLKTSPNLLKPMSLEQFMGYEKIIQSGTFQHKKVIGNVRVQKPDSLSDHLSCLILEDTMNRPIVVARSEMQDVIPLEQIVKVSNNQISEV
ncbi:hypothetical protein BLOT_006795 [Blomia tropicalis]|nr:hypothetical protein BLOT_006795 [Blomia tropicalis]